MRNDKHLRLLRANRGMTLIELLAVIVILGIIASIAVIVMFHIIEKSRQQAFVSNAFALYEAARLRVSAGNVEFLAPETSEMLTYKQLVADGVLEPVRDPFTGRVLSTDHNPSYVLVRKSADGHLQYAVCLKGETKQLCSYSDTQEEIPVKELSVSLITDIR
ncbi:type II secretion system protein [Anoxybacteroides rupiense]|uniref:type II secretion system protein n=1 Tax=Anoxybacteroides rupiense TaxID=311460 RepID=UPI002010FE78|nr:type II secretion system protein [Anoxybacillus rupiensis]